ncbi:MAG: hypothetical protein L0Y56_10780 [Nitrospira sp.]|nr:hypothetical protein [Nitrospira sp.]
MTKFEEYLTLCHAMQTGVAWDLEKDPSSGTPKHLRVGINTAMSDHGALVALLVKKGIITDDEYTDFLIEFMTREKNSYERKLYEKYGMKITLA